MIVTVKNLKVYKNNGDCIFQQETEEMVNGVEVKRRVFLDLSRPNITGVFVHLIGPGNVMVEKPELMMTFVGCQVEAETLAVVLPNNQNNKKRK